MRPFMVRLEGTFHPNELYDSKGREITDLEYAVAQAIDEYGEENVAEVYNGQEGWSKGDPLPGEDFDEPDPAFCEMCEGQLESMGKLGPTEHLKCRQCGMMHSRGGSKTASRTAAPDKFSGHNPNVPIRLFDTHPNQRFVLGSEVIPIDAAYPPVKGKVLGHVAEDRLTVQWPTEVAQVDVDDVIACREYSANFNNTYSAVGPVDNLTYDDSGEDVNIGGGGRSSSREASQMLSLEAATITHHANFIEGVGHPEEADILRAAATVLEAGRTLGEFDAPACRKARVAAIEATESFRKASGLNELTDVLDLCVLGLSG